jgi:DNA invertase Pin-like site-specific DNA recombinase
MKPLKMRTRVKRSKPSGRPPALDANHVASVKDMYASGVPVDRIAAKMKVSQRIIYVALGGIRKKSRKDQPS